MSGTITGCSIYAENEWISQGTLTFTEGKIVGVGSQAADTSDQVYAFPANYYCIPGMIDMHIHGANGADTMDATPEALRTIARALPAEGTTAFLATTITQSKQSIENALQNAAARIGNQPADESEIIGIHLEGPFISKRRAGAQPEAYILPIDQELFDRFQTAAHGTIKEVTLAPELPGAKAFIRHLQELGVVASIGHSDGIETDVVQAITAGATQVTHLFNGMRGLHHREPGIAGGALLHHELYTELICDGHHVCKEMVRLAYRLKGSDRLVLITDAMRAKCMRDGLYDLGGQAVHVANGKALLDSGTIAGSVLKMDQAWQNILDYSDATMDDVIQMGAVNPARQCGVYDRKGTLEPGKDADILILDSNKRLVMTFCRGQLAYQRKD
ncbi:MAG: N-acetylglucosamine-6-phosphate deacetylase [Sporolactobacillus sp.]